MLHHLPFWLRFSVSVLPLLAVPSAVLVMPWEASVGTALGFAYGCIALTELVYLAWLFAVDEEAPSRLRQWPR